MSEKYLLRPLKKFWPESAQSRERCQVLADGVLEVVIRGEMAKYCFHQVLVNSLKFLRMLCICDKFNHFRNACKADFYRNVTLC